MGSPVGSVDLCERPEQRALQRIEVLHEDAIAHVTPPQVRENGGEPLGIGEAVDGEVERVRELLLLRRQVFGEQRAQGGMFGEEPLVDELGQRAHPARHPRQGGRDGETLRLDLHRTERARDRQEHCAHLIERRGELARRREALGGLASQASIDDVGERGRHLGSEGPHRTHIAIDDGEGHLLAFEGCVRKRADQELVEHETESPDVGARRRGLSPP